MREQQMKIKQSRSRSRRTGADDMTSPTPRWPAPSPGRSVFCRLPPPLAINGLCRLDLFRSSICAQYIYFLYGFLFCLYQALYLDFCVVAMSRASKLTLACTGLGTAGIVYFVHWSQVQEKAVRTPHTSSYHHHCYCYYHICLSSKPCPS